MPVRLRTRGLCRGTGPARIFVAFGPGATWDNTSKAVSFFSERARVNERVTFGGSAAGRATAGTDWIKPPAKDCDTSMIWFVGAPGPHR